jgi:4-amino-4-deoxy-L-arabinose transferase-like glycosyltransferase
MPGYPWLMSVVFRLFGIFSPVSVIVVIGLNILFSSLSVIPLYRLAAKCFGHSAALLAAAVFVFYPPSIWHSMNSIWDTTIFTFLALCLLSTLSRYSGNFGGLDAVRLGLLMGLAAIVNAVVLIFYPFVAFWMVGWNRAAIVTREKRTFLFLLSMVIVLLLFPWILRNYYVFGRPMLRSNFGVELWLGNNEQIHEKLMHGRDDTYVDLHPTHHPGEFEQYVKLGEIAFADYKYSQAVDFILGNSDKFLNLLQNKIIRYWFGNIGASNEWTGNMAIAFPVSELKKVCYLLPIPFFFVGLI